MCVSVKWEELEGLRGVQSVLPPRSQGEAPVRRVGEPRVYIGVTSDGLAFELPVDTVTAFVKQLPELLSVPSVQVSVRRHGRREDYQVDAKGFKRFLDAHPDVVSEGSLMLELGKATLASGGGGCLLLMLEGEAGELRRRLATEALRVCGFDYTFRGENFTAIVWGDVLEVSEP